MNVFDKIKEKNILLTSHRGFNGGNIPCNSLEGYKIAANYGADVIEVDVTTSLDGELYMLHPGMEEHHFSKKIKLNECTKEQISEVMLANQDRVITQYKIATFDEMLETLKPYNCLINVDKFWSNPALISQKIREHGMTDRIIVKSAIEDTDIKVLEEVAGGLQFMAVTWMPDAHEILKKSKLNYIGLEVLFGSDDAEVVSDEFIHNLKKDGKILWGNSIVYYYKANISGTHTDDIALLGSPEIGWGWFAKKGFDIIQTDWLTECDMYLKNAGYRK